MTVAIKIRYTHHPPAGRKSWAVRPVDEKVVVQIPERCLMGAGIVKYIIGVVIAVKIGCGQQLPATGKRRPVSAPDMRRPGQIPKCRLTRRGIEQGIIGMAVAIEIRRTSHPPTGRKS